MKAVGPRAAAVREGMMAGNERFARSSFAVVPADEGSPWAVEILSSVSDKDEPKVVFSILFQGKTVTVLGHIGSDVTTDGWGGALAAAAGEIVRELKKREIPVSAGLYGEITECASLSRKHAIKAMIRSQASRLIAFIPPDEASMIWALEGARVVMES
jgi:hypothetical protein